MSCNVGNGRIKYSALLSANNLTAPDLADLGIGLDLDPLLSEPRSWSVPGTIVMVIASVSADDLAVVLLVAEELVIVEETDARWFVRIAEWRADVPTVMEPVAGDVGCVCTIAGLASRGT